MTVTPTGGIPGYGTEKDLAGQIRALQAERIGLERAGQHERVEQVDEQLVIYTRAYALMRAQRGERERQLNEAGA